MRNPFRWADGERLIVFGRGAVEDAVDALGGPGYTLLTTARAKDAAPGIVAAADRLVMVPGGHVDQLAADLLPGMTGDRLVALGGGRVVDTAKALAAALSARGGAAVRAMAVPTTLSGAEMTRIHRHAAGVAESTPRVRPAVVIVDPALAASQPAADLAASTLNALGHAIEAPCMVNANPVATLAAHEAVRLLRDGWAGASPDRDTLALGSLLAGYALDNTGLALHHVLAQTLVRVAGLGHGVANAAMLPYSIGALSWRRPEAIAGLEAAVGEDLAQLARRIGTPTLTELGVDPAVLPGCASAAAERPQLRGTPPPADRAEILALYESAL
jgi:alcohol dehydrogenase class IV